MDKHTDRISLDFDGCVTVGGETKGGLDIAPLRPGTERFLRELKRKGYEIVIHTARQPAPVKHFLRKHGLSQYVNEVSRTKLPSHVYIDDRAIEFRGDFSKALKQIEEFEPHWAEESDSKDETHPSDETLASKKPVSKALPKRRTVNHF